MSLCLDINIHIGNFFLWNDCFKGSSGFPLISFSFRVKLDCNKSGAERILRHLVLVISCCTHRSPLFMFFSSFFQRLSASPGDRDKYEKYNDKYHPHRIRTPDNPPESSKKRSRIDDSKANVRLLYKLFCKNSWNQLILFAVFTLVLVLIDWLVFNKMPILAVFQLYRGVLVLVIFSYICIWNDGKNQQ